MKNFTWGHGVILALGTFIVFILSLIFIFSSKYQNSELITDNYYEAELLYQDVINAKNNADTLKEKPQYQQNKEGILVTFPKAINNANSKFRIDLHRAEDQRLDVKKEVQLDGKNSIFVPAAVLSRGNYVLRVSWEKEKKPYQIDYSLVW